MPKKFIQKIGFNTTVQIIGKILSALLSAFSIFLLTRYLGVGGYGNFSLVFAYLTFFLAFTDFGFQSTIVNKLSKKEIDQEGIFSTYLVLKLLVILFMTFVSLFILLFLPYSHLVKSAIIFSSVAVGLGAFGGFGNTFFQYQLRLDLVGILDLVNKVITVVLIIIFVFLKLNFFYILSSVLISNIIGLILMFCLLKNSIKVNFKFNFDKALAYKIFVESLPIGFAGFLTVTYFNLDTIMLSIFKSSKEVGIYALSYNVFGSIIVIWSLYMNSFFPLLSRFKHSKNINEYNNLIKKSVIWALALSLLFMFFGFILSPLIVRIFAGNSFAQAILPLRILLTSCLFIFINAVYYNIFFIKGKTKFIIISLLISLIFNFLINLLIIPKYGYLGASITTVLTEVFLFLLYSGGIFYRYVFSKTLSDKIKIYI